MLESMTAFDAQALRRRKAHASRSQPPHPRAAQGNQFDAEKQPHSIQTTDSDYSSAGEGGTSRSAVEGTTELSASLTSIHAIIALEQEQKARANVARKRGRALPPQPNPLQAPDPLVAEPVASAIATAAARASAWRHRDAGAASPSGGSLDDLPHQGERATKLRLPSLNPGSSDRENSRRGLEPNLLQPSRYWQALGRRPTIPDGTGFLGRFKQHSKDKAGDQQRVVEESTLAYGDHTNAEEEDGTVHENDGSSREHRSAEQLAALEAGGFEEGGTVYVERGWEERLARQRARQAAQAEALAAAEAAAAEEAAEAARRAAPPSGRIQVLARDVNLGRSSSFGVNDAAGVTDAAGAVSELVAADNSTDPEEAAFFGRNRVGVVHAILTFVFDEPPSEGWHLHLEVYRWIIPAEDRFISAKHEPSLDNGSAFCSSPGGANDLEASPYDGNPAETALANHSNYTVDSTHEDYGLNNVHNDRNAYFHVDDTNIIDHTSNCVGEASHGSSVVCCEERLSEGEVLALLSAAPRADWVHPRRVNYYDDAQRERLEEALLPFLTERLQVRPVSDNSGINHHENIERWSSGMGVKGANTNTEVKTTTTDSSPARQQPVETPYRSLASSTPGSVVFVRRVFRAAVLLPWGPPRQRRGAPCLVEASVLRGGLVHLTSLPLGHHQRFGRPPPLVLARPALARAAEPYLQVPDFNPKSRQSFDANAMHGNVLSSAGGAHLENFLTALCRSRGGLRLAHTALGGVRLVVAGESDTSVRTHWGGEVSWPEDEVDTTKAM